MSNNMFTKSYSGESEENVVYNSVNLPKPDLIREPLIVDVLLSLGYKVFDNDEDRNDISGSLKLTDFLVSDIGRIIYAENRGSELQITVDSENLGYWTVEVKGLSSKEKEAEKLVDTIKTKICAEVKLKDGSSPMHMGLLAEYKKALLK